MDNMTALAYLKKMGGTKNQNLTALSKEIWEILIGKGITITVEHLAGRLNVEADFQSRSIKDSSEWKLCPKIFQLICKARWTPTIDLFASRISHQVPRYMSWKHDPYSIGRDAFQAPWKDLQAYAFPPFSLIPRVLKKIQDEKATLLLITPAWQTQAWYPWTLQLSIRNPILILKEKHLLLNPMQEVHPLVITKSLQLVVWTLSGNSFLQKEYQKKLQNLSLLPEEKAHFLVTNRPGESGAAGVIGEKLILFDVL